MRTPNTQAFSHRQVTYTGLARVFLDRPYTLHPFQFALSRDTHTAHTHTPKIFNMSKVSRGTSGEARQFYNDSGTLIRGKFLWFRELGSRKFMVLQRYKGKVRLHLRNYVLEDEEYVLVPTRRGVVLDKQQTRDLLCAMSELNKVVKKVSTLLIIMFSNFL